MSVFAFTALSAFSFAMAAEAALEGGFVVGALVGGFVVGALVGGFVVGGFVGGFVVGGFVVGVDVVFALKPSFICEK